MGTRRSAMAAKAAALGAVALLAACNPAFLAAPPATPPPAPEPTPRPAEPSAASRALTSYYARVEASLVGQGLLRTDGGGPDTPYGVDELVRNFERIALFEEYANIGGRLVARETASRLHRWDAPVRIAVTFGATVPEERRRTDAAEIDSYANRLARVTGHDIALDETAPNFHVFIVGEEDRRALGPRIREIIPGIGRAALAQVIDMPRSSYCLVFAWDPQSTGQYARAVAVIRAEHPPLLRRSCIHEELAQGLGLSNDSPAARPSVFNDDEEFGLLTSHDEDLLRILYDPRLRAGMTADEAMPIVRRIAAEIAGGAS